jgi:hypothetical protein
MAYWKMIKVGNDHFEVSHQEPKVDVCEKHYVFDAVPPAGSTKPLAFTPSGRCPVYETDPNVAEQAMAKQKNDDYQFAQMQNVATVPIETGTDGGMNRVFMSKLENPTYTYDNEGHLHVPPLQPGRLPPQISTKESSYAANNPSSAGGGTVSSFFGGLFNKNSTRVASTDTSSTGSTSAASTSPASAPTHTGFFASLFSSSNTQQANAPADTEQTATATAPPVKPSKPAARPRNNTDSQKSEPQVADTSKPKNAATPAPQKEANGAPPSNSGMLNGAQPVVPAGSFNNRWGFQ